jgi:hypothetical protein
VRGDDGDATVLVDAPAQLGRDAGRVGVAARGQIRVELTADQPVDVVGRLRVRGQVDRTVTAGDDAGHRRWRVGAFGAHPGILSPAVPTAKEHP